MVIMAGHKYEAMTSETILTHIVLTFIVSTTFVFDFINGSAAAA